VLRRKREKDKKEVKVIQCGDESTLLLPPRIRVNKEEEEVKQKIRK
jgi:hypothetical protein